MQLDLHVHRFDWAGTSEHIGPGITDLARRAEALGIHAMSVMDHYYQMDWMAPAEDPMLEGYTTLGFLAGVTDVMKLRLLVTGVTYRRPGLLAKIVSTLDVLSGSRAELGIGAAWYEREHLGLGVPFPPTAERFELLEEALQICLQMWSDDDGPFEGTHHSLEATLCRPMPVSKPRPRILIGGGGERKTLRLVARYADTCNLMGDPATVKSKIDVLRRHCDAEKRDVADIEITVMFRDLPENPTPADVMRGAEEFAALGVSSLVTGAVGPRPAEWMETTFGPVMTELGALEPSPQS